LYGISSPFNDIGQEELKEALNNTNIYDARFPVYTNVTAKPVTKKEEIKDQLYKQLTSPVRWEEIINNMVTDGFEEFYEVGPGRVLQGLVKRINPDVKCLTIDKYSDVEQYL
jgi:[acyl-carrier-protein] S-malonyltransferase